MTDGIQLLSPDDFPALLREIPDRPKRLYLRGKLPSEDARYLAVVGSRAMSPYGRRACRYLVEGLRGYPVVIVSGLAYGVDAESHKAALNAGLTTIGVPGSGLDWNVLYPKANVGLAREILSSGGCLLSEEKPEAKTMDYMFPKRNRIMAGLSHATLVVEAKEKSGTLITARLVTEYNRELLVVPGSIFDESSRGAHQFLRMGATAATCPEDILVALGIVKREGAASLTELREDLSEEERRVFEIISSPVSRDELMQALEIPITDANVLLSTMEIKGLIVEELGVVRIR
ncbi:MAG: DNA-processing protein DprA [Patescibacteria group bacterium]|nr:DNA-processing protein DprA [Patescibacteria group bacterium]